MMSRVIIICYVLLALCAVLAAGGHVGTHYAWKRVADIGQRVIPTLPKGPQSGSTHIAAWQIYEDHSQVPDDVKKLSLWTDLMYLFERLKWIGAIEAIIVTPVLVIVLIRSPD
jgi:hypothetical protein